MMKHKTKLACIELDQQHLLIICLCVDFRKETFEAMREPLEFDTQSTVRHQQNRSIVDLEFKSNFIKIHKKQINMITVHTCV